MSSRARQRRGDGGSAVLVRLHFFAGVFVGPLVVLAALTGLAYVFAPQLDRIAYGDLLRVPASSAPQAPLAAQVEAALRAHPDKTLVSVAPAEATRSTRVVLSGPVTVYVDPHDARILGELRGGGEATPVTAWLSELHRSLHLGAAGRLYLETAASWLWVLAVSGLVLWLGRRRHRASSRRALIRSSLWPQRGERGVRRTRSSHAIAGTWLAIGLLGLSVSGLCWTQHSRLPALQRALDAEPHVLNTALTSATAPPPGTAAARV
ncbi:PepSY-associated TM helix domain-containing protein, partial [Actinocorallia lasiicapitis]